MNIKDLYRQAERQFHSPDGTLLHEVADWIENHPEYARISETNRRQGLLRDVKRFFDNLANDEEHSDQLQLPGLELPSYIAVPVDGRAYKYVPTHYATLADLEAGLEIRNRNANAAIEKRDRYAASVDKLRPIMKDNPAMTAEEAFRIAFPDAEVQQ